VGEVVADGVATEWRGGGVATEWRGGGPILYEKSYKIRTFSTSIERFVRKNTQITDIQHQNRAVCTKKHTNYGHL